MNSKRRIFAGAIALSLTAAACGSDSDSGGGTVPAEQNTPATDAMTDGTAMADGTAAMTDSTEAMTDGTDAMTDSTEAMTDGTDAMTDTPAEVSGTLVGAGSSAQAAAMQGWQVGFQEMNPDATIEYDPVGSGGGREQFLAGGTDFAGSDAYLSDEELAMAQDRCGGDGAIDIPHYISPIAIAYNLPGVDELNLNPEVIAGIFDNQITSWSDPAIADINPDADLPDTAINPVHRSDESGTTKNFTDYLSKAAPDAWSYEAIEIWDGDGPGGGEGAQGTSGVVAAVGAGEGSIGYADASQVGELSTAKVGVAGEFVEYTPEAAGKIVDASTKVEGRGEFDYAIDVNRTPDDATVYPIALVSYHIVCLQYDTQEQVDFIKSFMTYVGSEEGQQAAADAAGSAPISNEVRTEIAKSIDAISVAS